MKRLFILASAAALMLASCAKTTVVYNEAPEEISFKQVTNVMTKAELPSGVKLGVIAYTDVDELYFGNTQFSHDGNTWSADKYWPVASTLDFIIYAPYISTGVTPTYTESEKKLVINVNNISNQTDWMYADKLYAQTQKNGGAAISVNLKHALAKIIVDLKADVDGVVTIKSFKITNTNQQSELIINQDAESNELEWGDMQTKDWELTVLKDEENKLTTTGRSDECLVIPGSQTSFVMTYTLDGVASDQTYTHTFSDATWHSGKKYIYDITIGVTEIKFTCTDEGWTEGNGNQAGNLNWNHEDTGRTQNN